MLALLGLGGAGVVGCTLAGIGGLLITANRKTQDTSRVVLVTATPGAEDYRYPAMQPRSVWGALPPDLEARNETGLYDADDNPEGWFTYTDPLPDAYQTVVVHHSVIDAGEDIATLQDIQDTHRTDRGWADVAYHYFVGQSGIVYEGRDVTVRGAHVGGFNTGSVGVCLLGDFTQITPPPAQIVAARDLIRWLTDKLALTHLAGHNDFNAETQCPGTNLIPLLATLAGDLTMGTDGYIPPDERAHASERAHMCPCCMV